MLEQIEIDWSQVTHTRENNSHSEQILFDQYERLNHNCKLIYDALKRGERLTGRDIMRRFDMCEYRKRISDLRDAGIEIKETTLKGGAKQWWIEN
jgi:hypothetical protein